MSYDCSENARRPMGGQGVPWEEARHDHNLPGARRARDPDVEGLPDRIVLCSAHCRECQVIVTTERGMGAAAAVAGML